MELYKERKLKLGITANIAVVDMYNELLNHQRYLRTSNEIFKCEQVTEFVTNPRLLAGNLAVVGPRHLLVVCKVDEEIIIFKCHRFINNLSVILTVAQEQQYEKYTDDVLFTLFVNKGFIKNKLKDRENTQWFPALGNVKSGA